MKRFLAMMLAMTMMGTTAYASEVKGFAKAKPVERKIELDDYNVEMKGYNINGYNYMRLRDVAKAMTDKANVDDYNFDVIYNQETNSVYLETGRGYKETEEGEKIRIHSDCLSCLAVKETEKYPEGISEAVKLEYKKGVLAILGNAKPSDSAPLLVKYISDLQQKMFGKGFDYTDAKIYFNDYVMKKAAGIEEDIFNAEDAVFRALQYAMTGNYIDFGTPSNVNEEKFDELVENAKNLQLDAVTYENLKKDLYTAKKLVVLTDNCGEIVFDKIMIKIL